LAMAGSALCHSMHSRNIEDSLLFDAYSSARRPTKSQAMIPLLSKCHARFMQTRIHPLKKLKSSHLSGSLLLLLSLLHNLLHNLLLLNQERTHNTVLDAVGAAGTSIRALDGLLWAGDGAVFAGTKGGDLHRPSVGRLSMCGL
jgi:hypothetical protein